MCIQWTLLYKSILDWQKYWLYFNAHLWAPTLTPKYIYCGISFRWPPGFGTDSAFLRTGLRTGFTYPASPIGPNRSSPRLVQPIWPMLSLSLNISSPCTSRGHDAISVVVDGLTKLVSFIPTKSTVAVHQLVYQFVDELFRFYGLPMDIVSDWDSKFSMTFGRMSLRS